MKSRWLIMALLSVVLAVLLGKGGLGQFTNQRSIFTQPQNVLPAPLFITNLSKTAEVALPLDSGYVNVKELGAKGDGVTDDTAVLRRVIGRTKEEGAIRAIYIPNGVYLVSDTLEWGDKRKEVWGQSRDGVVIKLKNHCPGFQNSKQPKKVLQVEFGHGGQNFDQRLRNLTVDVGQGNPGAIGIGFHTNNSGSLQNVVIRSTDPQRLGHTGLSLDKAWPGPGLIKNVAVDGFETGIYITQDQYSMTFEHITLMNQRTVGLLNSWNSVAIHDLKSKNRVPAVINQGQMALMALVDANLSGGDGKSPAIVNHSDAVLFARGIRTQGYGQAILNKTGQQQNIQGPVVNEFVSHRVSSPFPGHQTSLRLPIEDAPDIPYGDPKTWTSVTQFGARPDDGKDDGAAIQQAIASGATTIYFPAGVYDSNQSIRVNSNVRRLLGLKAQVSFHTPGKPAFIVADGTAKALAIEVDSAYGSQFSYWIEHASRRTLMFRGGSYINTVPGGKVFIEDTTAVPFVFDRQQVWIRQINTESYDHNPHIINKGGKVWILGLKTEKDRTIIGTYNGGQTEVLGGLLYKNQERIGPAPAFINENSQISLIYRNKGLPYQVQVLENRDGDRKEFHIQDLPASHGRMPLYISSKSGVF